MEIKELQFPVLQLFLQNLLRKSFPVFVYRLSEKRTSWFQIHRIHVWYICFYIWGILMVNVTIYSIHGSYIPYVSICSIPSVLGARPHFPSSLPSGCRPGGQRPTWRTAVQRQVVNQCCLNEDHDSGCIYLYITLYYIILYIYSITCIYIYIYFFYSVYIYI